MERVEFIIPPGYGEYQRDISHSAQAVRIGNRLETAGQGGWVGNYAYPEGRSLTEETISAFDHMEEVLKNAGATWNDVVALHYNHVPKGKEVHEAITGQLCKRMPNRFPVITSCAVTTISREPKMRLEIRVTAIFQPNEDVVELLKAEAAVDIGKLATTDIPELAN